MLGVCVSYLAVLMAGLIAGLLLGTAVDHYQLRVLAAEPWVLARQSIDSVFSRVLPFVWNGTLILLIAAACLNHGAARWFFAASAVLLLAGVVVTVAIEVPINKAIASWTPAIPADWSSIRDKWLSFHTIRTAAGMIAFACALLGITRS